MSRERRFSPGFIIKSKSAVARAKIVNMLYASGFNIELDNALLNDIHDH
jgi:hypothetical protein